MTIDDRVIPAVVLLYAGNCEQWKFFYLNIYVSIRARFNLIRDLRLLNARKIYSNRIYSTLYYIVCINLNILKILIFNFQLEFSPNFFIKDMYIF